MRRSFGVGGNGRMGGGGGGGGGGGMLRTVQRAVRAGVGGAAQEPFSHSTTTTTTTTNANSSSSSSSSRHNYKPTTSNVLSLSSSTTSLPFSPFNLPISATSTLPTWPSSCSSPTGSEDFEWECVDGSEYERPHVFNDDFVFGSVPSKDEVQHAVSALQQVLDPASFSQFVKDRLAYNSDKDVADEITSPTGLVNRVSSVGTELDWIEPSLQLCSPRMLQPYGSDRVYDAFHLLQTEPCIQRMVVSLSSDKAVWDAVLNNEVVRELRESLSEVDKSVHENPDDSSDGSNAAMNILSWIFDNTKAKAKALIEKITKLVNELFQPPEHENTTAGEETYPFEEKLRTSFLLSILVLLIVVVNRAHRA